jgi:hypothetical protein
MTDKHTIPVFSGKSGRVETLSKSATVDLPVDELRKNLKAFLDAFKDALPDESQQPAGLGLKTVSVAVGIDGKGTVGLWGTGVEVGGNATLTLTFERK